MNPDPKAAELVGDLRRKRLRFQCWHRGIREMDLILGGFADRHLDTLSEDELDMMEQLLVVADPTLYLWVSERESAPAQYDTALLRRLKAYVTAAQPHG